MSASSRIAAACRRGSSCCAWPRHRPFVAAPRRLLVLPDLPARQVPEMAENNHQRTLPLRAPRGVIFDRHGEVLVENRASFNISIMREHSRDLDRTVRLLAAGGRRRRAEMREIVERHRREPSYRPIVIVQDASLAQVAAVTARRLDFELPDVVVQQVPTRRYPGRRARRAPARLRRRSQRTAGGRWRRRRRAR